jgi:hypothetical protein
MRGFCLFQIDPEFLPPDDEVKLMPEFLGFHVHLPGILQRAFEYLKLLKPQLAASLFDGLLDLHRALAVE